MSRSLNIWLGLGCAAFLVLGALLLVWPAHRANEILDAKRAELELELRKPSDGPETIERLSGDLAQLREEAAGRSTPIPKDSDVAGLMGELSRFTQEAGIQNRDISTQEPRKLEEASALSVLMRLDGPFDSVYQILSRIEELPRLVRLGRVRIETEGARRGEVSAPGVVRAEVLIEAFYAPTTGNVQTAAAGGDS